MRWIAVLTAFGLVGPLLVGKAGGFPSGGDQFRWYSGLTVNIDPDSCAFGTPKGIAVRNGISSWGEQSVPGSQFPFGTSTEIQLSNPDNIGDGYNEITFEVFDDFTNNLTALTRYIRSDTTIVTCPCLWHEHDMVINSAVGGLDRPFGNPILPWAYDASSADPAPDPSDPGFYTSLNLEGTVRHEMGHMIGFFPEEESDVSLMTGLYSYGKGNDPWMHGDDRNGVRTYYPASGSPPAGGWETEFQLVGWKLDSGRLVPVSDPTPSNLSAGQTVHVEYTLENLGTEPSFLLNVGYYLSRNTTISQYEDVRIDSTTEAIPHAAVGGHGIHPWRPVDHDLHIPCATDTGYYYLGAILDYANNVPWERRKSNNTLLFPIPGRPARIHVSRCPQPPAQPQGLGASTIGCYDCRLSWSFPVSGGYPTRHIVFRDGAALDTVYDQFKYDDTRPPYGNHTYYIVAQNGDGSSDPSSQANGFIASSNNAEVAYLSASRDRCDGVHLTWGWPSGVALPDSFVLTVNGRPTFRVTLPGTATNYLDSTAPVSCFQYCVGSCPPVSLSCADPTYTVQSKINSQSCTSFGVSATGRRLDRIQGTPANLRATSSRLDAILLNWNYRAMPLPWVDTVVEACRFQVYRNDTTAAPVFETAGQADSSWLDIGVGAGATATYYVRAINSCSQSPLSAGIVGRRGKFTISTNVPGASFYLEGNRITLASGEYAVPCSTATVSRGVTCDPTQTVAGTRYCFDSWSNSAHRPQTISVSSDTTITLRLVPSGSGPTTVAPGAFIYDDAYDCKSPYIFQGGATLTTSSPTDTFRTWGAVKFRFPVASGSQTRVGLAVLRPLIASGVDFETTDSTAASADNLWTGISLGANGSVFLTNCNVRNADYGIKNIDIAAPVPTVNVEGSTFQFNRSADIIVWLDANRSPSTRVVGNNLYDKQGVQLAVASTSLTPIATATIQNNFFYTAPTTGGFAALDIKGAWQGQVTGNTFTLGQAGSLGILLGQYFYNCGVSCGGAYGSPSVSINNNRFSIVAGNSRFALKTAQGPVTTINAELNDWNIYDASQIPAVIYDHVDDATRAEAIFQPFVGAGGGGGTGGCPFVFSRDGDTFKLENSILGLSEQTVGSDVLVSDACPVQFAGRDQDGRVRIRIAELETETDQLDYVGLASVQLANGEDIGSNPAGEPLVFQREAHQLLVSGWTGRAGISIAAISPNVPLSGQHGDSLEFTVDPTGGTPAPIGVHLQHKQPAGSLGHVPSVGVTVRVSPSSSGDDWITLGTIVPREGWSTTILEVAALRGVSSKRIRLVWNADHTLGWVGFVQTRPANLTYLPLVSATQSDGSSVRDLLLNRDARSARLRTGQHVDLEYDASSMPDGGRLVLISHGRYDHGGMNPAPAIPARYYLGANRPNPFNPETDVEFGLPKGSVVQVRVFDVSGRLVKNLLNTRLPAGVQTVRWNGKNNQGADVGSGVYYLDLRAADFRAQRRMVLLR